MTNTVPVMRVGGPFDGSWDIFDDDDWPVGEVRWYLSIHSRDADEVPRFRYCAYRFETTAIPVYRFVGYITREQSKTIQQAGPRHDPEKCRSLWKQFIEGKGHA